MPFLHVALTWIRNHSGFPSSQGPAFWIVTLLIALLVPSPIAVPVVIARLRRGPDPRSPSA